MHKHVEVTTHIKGNTDKDFSTLSVAFQQALLQATLGTDTDSNTFLLEKIKDHTKKQFPTMYAWTTDDTLDKGVNRVFNELTKDNLSWVMFITGLNVLGVSHVTVAFDLP